MAFIAMIFAISHARPLLLSLLFTLSQTMKQYWSPHTAAATKFLFIAFNFSAGLNVFDYFSTGYYQLAYWLFFD